MRHGVGVLGVLALTWASGLANEGVHGSDIASGGILTQGDENPFSGNYLVSQNGHYRAAVWGTGEFCVYRVDALTGYQAKIWSSFKAHGGDYATEWVKAKASFTFQVRRDGEVGVFAQIAGYKPFCVWRWQEAAPWEAGGHVVLTDGGDLRYLGTGPGTPTLTLEP